MIDFTALAAPFPPELVSWRPGATNRDKSKAMALAYIDARDVMGRFDDVCGPAGWQRRHPHVEKTTTCEIDVWVDDRGWITKTDGAGDTAVEAEKGSLSDSFKRAAINWGVGRYLYDLPSPWVEIDEYKKIKPHELGKLEAILRGKNAPTRIGMAPQDPEQSGLFIACKAAIDMADEQGQQAGLTAWANDNKPSMANMEAEYPEVYKAVKRYYAGKLKPYMPVKAAA